MNKIMLTQDGLDRLKNQLSQLFQKRDQLITRIEEVAQPDEAGEDALATQLKEELELTNSQIDKLEESVNNSEIINGQSDKNQIQVGSKVKLKLSGETTKEFHIVSEMEVDPTSNKISDQSPLGQALLGRKVNEEIEFEAPVGKMTYKIVSIH